MASAGLAGAVTTGAAHQVAEVELAVLPRITRAFRPLMATWSTTKLLDSSGTATARRVLSLLPASDSDTPCGQADARAASSISPSMVRVRS